MRSLSRLSGFVFCVIDACISLSPTPVPFPFPFLFPFPFAFPLFFPPPSEEQGATGRSNSSQSSERGSHGLTWSSSAVTVALSRARATAGYCMQTRPVDFGSKYPPPCNATNTRYLAEPKITKASWTRFGRYCTRVCVRGVSKMRNFVQPRQNLSASRSPACYLSSGRGLSLSLCTVPSNTYLRRPSLRQGNEPYQSSQEAQNPPCFVRPLCRTFYVPFVYTARTGRGEYASRCLTT